jgi:AcrR family transcriptional regulator
MLPAEPSEPSAARERLLERCVAYLQEAGFSQLSLREIAAGTGTSHRMLIYHFGSRDGLLVDIVGYLEAQQRAVLADLAAQPGDLIDICRAFGRRLTDPALAPFERLFFEVYAHALYHRPWTAPFRESVIAAWDKPLTELFSSHGFPRAEAARRSRLALAVARGLLLDLLITGDRRQVTAAADLFAEMISTPVPDPTRLPA